MFGIKQLKEEVKELKAFEKAVKKIIENYFQKNEKTVKQYSVDGTIDNFYQFVNSVDQRITEQSNKLDELEEQINQSVFEKEERENLIGVLKNEVSTKNAIIQAQEKEIKALTAKKSKAVKKESK